MDKMVNSAFLQINIGKLKNRVQSESGSNVKDSKIVLHDTPENYAIIIANIMKPMWERNFYFNNYEKDELNGLKYSRYVSVIRNIVKNFKSSSSIKDYQKEILEKDTKIKQLVVKVMIEIGIVTKEEGILIPNAEILEQHKQLYISANNKSIRKMYESYIIKIVEEDDQQ